MLCAHPTSPVAMQQAIATADRDANDVAERDDIVRMLKAALRSRWFSDAQAKKLRGLLHSTRSGQQPEPKPKKGARSPKHPSAAAAATPKSPGELEDRIRLGPAPFDTHPWFLSTRVSTSRLGRGKGKKGYARRWSGSGAFPDRCGRFHVRHTKRLDVAH